MGGKSRRMGEPKAQIRIGCRTCIEHVIHAVKPVVSSLTLVGETDGLAFLGLPQIPDARPGYGPLCGLETAFLHAAAIADSAAATNASNISNTSDASGASNAPDDSDDSDDSDAADTPDAPGAPDRDLILVIACDIPCIRSDVLRHLIDSIGDHDAAVPLAGGLQHPLCAVYHRSTLPMIQNRLERGVYGMLGFLAAIDCLDVTHDASGKELDPNFFINVNTPEDLERVRDCIEG
ncbi:MAG: molybdenum cofactor guanylyltransferase [Candidatus Eisenbacteria bacterium]|nr:molybdenum cofactor guanylyltransferase [Candidatus Eisenbacteria bacterium]